MGDVGGVVVGVGAPVDGAVDKVPDALGEGFVDESFALSFFVFFACAWTDCGLGNVSWYILMEGV